MKLNELLHWRYATKSMNGQKVSAEKIEAILDNTRLAASSGGLQPYKILVIASQELRDKVKEVAYNQQAIGACSHLLVFAAWDEVTPERVDNFVNHVAETRNIPVASLEGLRAMFDAHVAAAPAANFAWASKQSYIALGTALIAAAEQQVDATPMEGFENDKLDALLGLEQRGLKSAALMTIGYRDAENDWLVNLPKVRTPKEELYLHL